MSRPVRPYRATVVGGDVTHHYDYATKEARAHRWLGLTPPTLTTVTSRKPLKPGTPVCWVNVYAEGTGPSPAVHSTKEFADRGADKTRRLHCIPVYLPGEGAESLGQQDAEGYELEARTQRERADKAEAKVSDMAVRLCIATGGRGMSEDEQRMSRAVQDAARAAHDALAEVERLKSQLSDSRGYGDLQRERANKAEAEVERLTKELAAAQAQAMPAGKVVYVASGKFGINRDFQTIEFADKRLRDTYRKADGWTWFTRVEES